MEQIVYMQSNWVDVAIGTFIFLCRYFNSVVLIAFNSMYSFFLVSMHNWNPARLKATAVIISYTSKAEILMWSRNQSIFLCIAWLFFTYFCYSKAKWYQSASRISDNNLEETWVNLIDVCKSWVIEKERWTECSDFQSWKHQVKLVNVSCKA